MHSLKKELIKGGVGVVVSFAAVKVVNAVIKPLLPEPVRRVDEILFAIGTSAIGLAVSNEVTKATDSIIDGVFEVVEDFKKNSKDDDSSNVVVV